jgi:hypothetical protein
MTLFLECKPDQVLATVAGVPARVIVHSHGKGRVARYLSTKSAVRALVDEDPGSAEPASFAWLAQVSAAHDIRLRVDKSKNNELVVLCPRLEDWVIKTAKASNVKLDQFNLSDTPRDLHAEINYRLTNFERLLRKLLELHSPRLLHLKSLLSC